MTLKDTLRAGARRLGYVVQRWPPNRFEAMDAALEMLASRGYRPRVVIDGGANRGQWFATASPVFPEAAFHLVEPQDVCWPALEAAAASRGRTTVHRTAITAPGVGEVRMSRGGDAGNTGAFVITAVEGHWAELTVTATTLDALVAGSVTAADRVLLKLDLEGHELAALRGAAALLPSVEVIVMEVRFFDIYHAGRPLFAEAVAFLDAQGFLVYDIDMLSSRPSDRRLRFGDVIFVRRDSLLAEDVGNE